MGFGPRIFQHSMKPTVRVIHRPCHFFLIIAMAAVLAVTATVQAVCSAEKLDDEAEDVSSYRIKVRRLQKVISRQEAKIEEAKKEERNILEELEGLDKKLIAQQKKLEDLNGKIERQQDLIHAGILAAADPHKKKLGGRAPHEAY